MTKIFILVSWLRDVYGNDIAMIGQYSYYRSARTDTSQHWSCAWSDGLKRKCQSCVVMTNTSDKIISMNVEHYHPPLKYAVQGGIFIKM